MVMVWGRSVRTTRAALALVAALSLVVGAACSSGDDDDAGPEGDPAAEGDAAADAGAPEVVYPGDEWDRAADAAELGFDQATLDELAAQAVVVWSNIGAILDAAEMSIGDVVSVTTYVVVGQELGPVMAARDAVFAGHVAASTLVTVPALARPEWRVEVAVVAAACSRFLIEPDDSFGAELLTDGAAATEEPIDLTEPAVTPALVD